MRNKEDTNNEKAYVNKTTYGNHIVYDRGLKPTPEKIERINQVLSRCWDSLPDEKKEEINRRIEEKQKQEKVLI